MTKKAREFAITYIDGEGYFASFGDDDWLSGHRTRKAALAHAKKFAEDQRAFYKRCLKAIKKEQSPRRREAYSEVKIAWVQKDNPKRPGCKAFKAWNEMTRYRRTHRNATAADVFANTSYQAANLKWDRRYGFIKTKHA